MHTDEYEISLAREIEVCRSVIKNAEKKLRKLAKKYALRDGEDLPESLASERDRKLWNETRQGLHDWKDKLADYERLLGAMKI